jgi:transcriptional regulator with XRE-family HTH domain
VRDNDVAGHNRRVAATGPSSCGGLLRAWREARGLSQLQLAEATGTSQRHLSYLESGRAQPSAALIQRLAGYLTLPAIERNALLAAAGFAPHHGDPGFAPAELARIDQALGTLLEHHEPYPATVLTRDWTLRLANRATARVLGPFFATPPVPPINVMTLCFDPEGLRPAILDWDALAPVLLARVRSELRQAPGNDALRALLLRLERFPGLPEPTPLAPAGPPVFSLRLRKGTLALDLVTVVATLGTTPDIAQEELRLELYLPADDAARKTMAALSAG